MPNWTPKQDEILKREWEKGTLTKNIALLLGESMTKSAVAGRARRLGLTMRATVSIVRKRCHEDKSSAPNSKPAQGAKKAPAPPPEKKKSPQAFAIDGVRENNTKPIERSKPAPLMRTVETIADKECRWPFGSPGTPTFGFCGHPRQPGLPYCEHHCTTAYKTEPPRIRKGFQILQEKPKVNA